MQARLVQGLSVASASVALIAIAGCGSSGAASNGEASKTGPQVAKDAASALKAAGSVHFAGTVVVDGASDKIDLQLQSDGATGSLTVGGAPADLVVIGSTSYVKAAAAFYTSTGITAANAAKVANRWVKLPPDSDFKTLSFADITSSVDEPDPKVKIDDKVTTGTLNGQKVVVLHASDGSTLDVAATGKAYPLRIVSGAKSSGGAGAGTLSGFGEHQTLKAPAGAIDPVKVIGNA